MHLDPAPGAVALIVRRFVPETINLSQIVENLVVDAVRSTMAFASSGLRHFDWANRDTEVKDTTMTAKTIRVIVVIRTLAPVLIRNEGGRYRKANHIATL